MNNNKKIVFIVYCLFLIGCSKKQPLAFVCFSDFQKDRLTISYSNIILVDTIITTNESIGIAFLTDLYLDKTLSKHMSISLNNVITDSVSIENNLCSLLVSNNNGKLHIEKDTVCKPKRIL